MVNFYFKTKSCEKYGCLTQNYSSCWYCIYPSFVIAIFCFVFHVEYCVDAACMPTSTQWRRRPYILPASSASKKNVTPCKRIVEGNATPPLAVQAAVRTNTQSYGVTYYWYSRYIVHAMRNWHVCWTCIYLLLWYTHEWSGGEIRTINCYKWFADGEKKRWDYMYWSLNVAYS